MEKTLLAPLRSALERWMDDPEVSTGGVDSSSVLLHNVTPFIGHLHDIMPLVSLKTGVERVDNVISRFKSTISQSTS